MIKYRDFMSLTDDEVKQIITDLFHPKQIVEIKRDDIFGHIHITFDWEWDEETIMTDTVDLTLPTPNHSGITADFSLTIADYNRYNQFLIAKGCNEYLKNNPYLEE